MINSKQRAYLKSLANNINPIFQIGKSGITPEIIEAVSLSIDKREIIKVSILNNCTEDIKYVASALGDRTKSEVVQIIGKKIILYKESKENKQIILPK